ncbi:Arc family DNA-binding protein [Anaerocellum danielii]|uniref:Arc family DNA-binding protein n=1 Tax=Anaerocellum danielii TaxID=1387557 RepID=A0ABZ0TY91_9FIRM|nr:Arc family DNA-binding protein [Caldicellulosiruptor danielii]WPX08182.1 Arc family DNA-binding protein [Caldicellulosiruptor danielii]
MPSNLPTFTLRLPEKLLAKLRVIAGINKRSVNKEIEFLVERYVKEFEEKHGEIKIEKENSE